MWTWTRTLQHVQWARLVQPRGALASAPARWHCLVGFPEEEEEQLMWKVLVAVASVVTERVVTAPRKQARATQAEVSMPGSHTRLWRRLWSRVGVDASDNNSEDVVDRRCGYDE